MQAMSKASERKAEIVEKTVETIKQYGVIGVADLHKIHTGLLQDLKRQLKGKVVVKCVKNTLLKRAMGELKLPGAEEFFKEIPGSNIFIFSDMNPFKLALLLNKNKVSIIAKPGDIAPREVIVPSGNTGIAPGPILSKLGAVGLKTRIDSGTIWVAADTVVAEAGGKISEDLAEVLARLGIKAAERGLTLKAVYDNSRIISGKELMIDLEAVREQLKTAAAGSLQVAITAAYPTPETIVYLLSMARENSLKVALESDYVTTETAPLIIAKAHAMAAALEQKTKELEKK
jgi:large subunit ribosomal protein L10